MFIRNLLLASRSLRTLVAVAALVGLTSLAPAPAEASVGTASPVAFARASHHGDRCTKIRATGVGQDHGDGTTSASISVHGVVVGTTTASFATGSVDGVVASIAGQIIFTSDVGTLTAQVAGTFNTQNGRFVAKSRSISGTGGYAGLTGRLTFRGTESLTDGSFTEKVTGKLCSAAPGC